MVTNPAPSTWATYAAIVLDFVVKAVALGLVPVRRRPSSAMAWLILIFFVPGVGIAVFLLLGSPYVSRRRRRAQGQAGAVIRQEVDFPVLSSRSDWPGWLNAATSLNRKLGWLDTVAGNDVRIFPDYQASIKAMAAEIDRAERYVHAEFYIVAWDSSTDPFFTALAAAVERGVTVRLLFDHVACLRVKGYRTMLKRLRRSGIQWHPMLPLQPLRGRWRRPDLRNHRKILIVDGRSGFSGSQNVIDASYHNRHHERLGRRWKDLITRTEGPVVNSLDLVFATDWFLETQEILSEPASPVRFAEPPGRVVCQVLPSGPGFPDENNLRMFNTLIYGAEFRLSITSPYFVPDESLLYAITTAAQRGVEVELFVSEVADQFMVDHAQKSYYTSLLESGVRIFAYPAPAILHAKHVTVDDKVAVIGSSNMDIRSFALDFEVSVIFIDRDFVADLQRVEDGYRAISPEITLAHWRRRALPKRYLDNVMRLTSALQ